jgi:hypothetical protein
MYKKFFSKTMIPYIKIFVSLTILNDLQKGLLVAVNWQNSFNKRLMRRIAAGGFH